MVFGSVFLNDRTQNEGHYKDPFWGPRYYFTKEQGPPGGPHFQAPGTDFSISGNGVLAVVQFYARSRSVPASVPVSLAVSISLSVSISEPVSVPAVVSVTASENP